MLGTVVAEPPVFDVQILPTLGRFFKGFSELFAEKEQPVSIEYAGMFPAKSAFDPPRDHLFVVEYTNKPESDPERKKIVIVWGDAGDEPNCTRAGRFVKSYDPKDLFAAVETYSITGDGQEKVDQSKVPEWLGKKLQDAYDGHQRHLIELGRQKREALAKASGNKFDHH